MANYIPPFVWQEITRFHQLAMQAMAPEQRADAAARGEIPAYEVCRFCGGQVRVDWVQQASDEDFTAQVVTRCNRCRTLIDTIRKQLPGGLGEALVVLITSVTKTHEVWYRHEESEHIAE
jgi:RecJ-like exonuclease